MQRIKELRKEKSMNQIALGMELNFSQKIISEYENGKVEPSITTLKKLASIFNTSVDYNWIYGHQTADWQNCSVGTFGNGMQTS